MLRVDPRLAEPGLRRPQLSGLPASTPRVRLCGRCPRGSPRPPSPSISPIGCGPDPVRETTSVAAPARGFFPRPTARPPDRPTARPPDRPTARPPDRPTDRTCASLTQVTDVLALCDRALILKLDLSSVSFIDSSGLHTLLHLRRDIGNDGGTLELCGVTGQALRLLDITGTRPLFTVRPAA
ncbi:STAS domain-containing protein [Streptomyces sp. NPDC058128]|uniref:STAS domain-containing protein n=1 Tax=Streptomyces sp. NPDC058128 TaxID=3346352 RepID=UPI0036DFB670